MSIAEAPATNEGRLIAFSTAPSPQVPAPLTHTGICILLSWVGNRIDYFVCAMLDPNPTPTTPEGEWFSFSIYDGVPRLVCEIYLPTDFSDFTGEAKVFKHLQAHGVDSDVFAELCKVATQSPGQPIEGHRSVRAADSSASVEDRP